METQNQTINVLEQILSRPGTDNKVFDTVLDLFSNGVQDFLGFVLEVLELKKSRNCSWTELVNDIKGIKKIKGS